MSSWRNEKNRGKIGFAFSMLAEWWKWKMLHWLTVRHGVWMQTGTIWWRGGVLCTKNYLPPSGNEEYYTTAPQCETLHCRTLCWFAYFAASPVCWRSVFLHSMEYEVNNEVECYHCYVLITRMVSLLSPYRRTQCLPYHILLAVLALAMVSWLVTQAQQLLFA